MIRDLCGLTLGLPRPIRTTSVGLWKHVDLWCGDLRGQWHNASSGAGWISLLYPGRDLPSACDSRSGGPSFDRARCQGGSPRGLDRTVVGTLLPGQGYRRIR